jgi:rhamnosyltransferase
MILQVKPSFTAMVQAWPSYVQVALSSCCCSSSVEESLLAASPTVAGVVVLYRPGPEVLENVGSYLDQVDALYAVDNTEQPEVSFVSTLSALPRVSYVSNGGNLGVAAALNVGARRALAEGYEWLLTMDQDSTATPGMVDRMLACSVEPLAANAGLISPHQVQVGGAAREPRGCCAEVLTPMTSGSLVRLSAYSAVGPFMEGLFIDQVDDEFCLRLHTAGFKVLEAGDATLMHRVGHVRHHRFPLPLYTTDHPPVRRYYMTRNLLYVGRLYRERFPEYRRSSLKQIGKDLIKIVLYEGSKSAKLRMMVRGYRDYRQGRLGPYQAQD